LVVTCQGNGGGGATWLGKLRGRPWRAAPASLLARLDQRRGRWGAPVLAGTSREGSGSRWVAAWSRPKEEDRGGKRREKKKEKREKKTKKRKRKIEKGK
jgi:hypothetical protein